MSALLWFVNTRLGQTLILAAGVLLAAGLAYHWAYHRGELACDARHLAATLAAQTRQQSTERAATQTAETIADTTTKQAQSAVKETIEKTETIKEAIRYVYRDPPKTAPVAPGSCVHPLDPRVQERIDNAVERANAASGGLPAADDRADSRATEGR